MAPAGVHGHFGRRRPGDGVAGPDEVKELPVGQPSPLLDQLPLHEGDVGRRPPEGGDAQPAEEQRQLPETDGLGPSGRLAHDGIQPARLPTGVRFPEYCGKGTPA